MKQIILTSEFKLRKYFYSILHSSIYLHSRCILSDVTLPDLSEANLLKSELFKDLLKKDLLFNVYKDGKWGSYRHLPLDTGKHSRVSIIENLHFQSKPLINL